VLPCSRTTSATVLILMVVAPDPCRERRLTLASRHGALRGRAHPTAHPESVREPRHAPVRRGGPKRRRLANGGRGSRRRHRALRRGAGPVEHRCPDRRQRPRRAEPVLAGAHRRRAGERATVGAGSLRRRAHRWFRLGSRRHRHVQPHRVHGRRVPAARRQWVPPARHADLRRGRRRGGRRTLWRRAPRARAPRRRPLRLPVTESGGFPLPSPSGIRLPYLTDEKGPLWATMTVRGTAGHGSMPFRTDNALVKAAEVVRRLGEYRSRTRIDDAWRGFVEGLGIPAELAEPLLREEGFADAIEMLPLGISKMAYSCTHTTITPTVLTTGHNTNVIPDEVTIKLDVRVLPGDGPDAVRAMIDEALGDLATAGSIK